MKFREDIYLGFTGVLAAISVYFALFIAPAEVELGELVRIFYFHLPPALSCYLALIVSVVTGLIYIRTKDYRYDAVSESGAILGIVYGIVTLIGGAIWANATWGVYWNWDPRETTTLILWFAYIGYFLLRMSIENPERRASSSAIYNVLAFLTVPLSYMSFILWPSLHPRLSEGGGLGLTPTMVQALVMNLITGFFIFGYLLKKTYERRMKADMVDRQLREEL
ncbi:MAG: cytochrome c biogenesis protein [Candidatus Bathyarchaeota archaeon]|nr:cytochrome c biogenesis protein [Candidatus Bathyarchaeota archaeon]